MKNTTREKSPTRKKKTTVSEAERAVYSELLESLKDYHGDSSYSQVLLKLILLLPADTFVLLRLSGKSYSQIASEINLSKYAVFNLATFYKSMDPPFGGFEPLQINYLKKQLNNNRTLSDIAKEINTALDRLEGVLPEGLEDNKESVSPASPTGLQSEFKTWFTSTDPAATFGTAPDSGRPSIEPSPTEDTGKQEPDNAPTEHTEASSPDDIWETPISSGEPGDAAQEPSESRDLNVVVQTFDSFNAFTGDKDTDRENAKSPKKETSSDTSPKKAELQTIRVTEQGLKYYMDDFDIHALPEKSLAKIIEFRLEGKDQRKRETNNMYLWKNLAAYFQESDITLKGYVHQQVFPPKLVALYRLSGYSFDRIVDTVSKEDQELLSLTGTRLAIVQKTSYRSNPEYEVIPVADLLEMLPNGTNPAKISAKDIEKITEKYKSSLSAPKAEVIPQNGRKKIFTAKLTKKGIVNYIKDITQPSASQKKTAKKEVDNR